jgi:hypothetical protein
MESSPHNLKEEQLGFRNNSPCLKRITRGRDSTKQQAGSTLLQAGSTLLQAGSTLLQAGSTLLQAGSTLQQAGSNLLHSPWRGRADSSRHHAAPDNTRQHQAAPCCTRPGEGALAERVPQNTARPRSSSCCCLSIFLPWFLCVVPAIHKGCKHTCNHGFKCESENEYWVEKEDLGLNMKRGGITYSTLFFNFWNSTFEWFNHMHAVHEVSLLKWVIMVVREGFTNWIWEGGRGELPCLLVFGLGGYATTRIPSW